MTGEENGNPRANGFMRGFLGGHPLAVFLRLALISFLVGIVLSVFGVTPKNFFDSLDAFARFLYDLGFGAFEWLLEYLVVGAMLVVPIWLIIRLFRAGGIKTD